MRKKKQKEIEQKNDVWADYNKVHCLNCTRTWTFKKGEETPDAKTFICPICRWRRNKEKEQA